MQENAPFFTVVIPVYNKDPHIARSVNSVLGQEFQDFELLLVNDASTDNSLKEILKFSDPRIRILHRDIPGPGGYAARNLGIREARAEWVAFLDADDEWYPEHLKKMRELIERFPGVKFFSCGREIRGDGPTTRGNYSIQCASNSPHLIDCKTYLEHIVKGREPVWTGVIVINKKIQIAPRLFPEEKEAKRGGDSYAWLKLICSLKVMAWSPHIGAITHRDSVNRVSKTAPFSFCLTNEDAFNELAGSLDQEERQLLKKVFNRRTGSIWLRCATEEQGRFSLMTKFFWRGDAAYCVKRSLISFLPATILRSLIRLKRAMRSAFS